MYDFFRKTISHPVLALGSTILGGLFEFMALQGAKRARGKQQ